MADELFGGGLVVAVVKKALKFVLWMPLLVIGKTVCFFLFIIQLSQLALIGLTSVPTLKRKSVDNANI